jgi:hypothetical protein
MPATSKNSKFVLSVSQSNLFFKKCIVLGGAKKQAHTSINSEVEFELPTQTKPSNYQRKLLPHKYIVVLIVMPLKTFQTKIVEKS